MPYATLSQVEARVRQTFTSTSQPSIDTVTAWLEESETWIKQSLAASRIPITGEDNDEERREANNKKTEVILGTINADQVAARVLQMVPDLNFLRMAQEFEQSGEKKILSIKKGDLLLGWGFPSPPPFIGPT